MEELIAAEMEELIAIKMQTPETGRPAIQKMTPLGKRHSELTTFCIDFCSFVLVQ